MTSPQKLQNQKISKISTHVKLNWAKYDLGLTGVITNPFLIKDLLEAAFHGAGYERDFQKFKHEHNIQLFVEFRLTSEGYNVKQVQDLAREMYNIDSSKFAAPGVLNKSQDKSPSRLSPDKVDAAAEAAKKEDYHIFYKNIERMAKDRNWSQKQFFEALKDKEYCQKEYAKVS